MNNDINTLTKKVKAMTQKVDAMNYTMDHKLRTQELRRIMRSEPKTPTQQVDIVDALRSIANSINPAILR